VKSYIFGQLTDPNIVCIKHHFDEFVDLNSVFEWDLQQNKFYVNKELIEPGAVFMRHNVFEPQTHKKYSNQYMLYNYLLANPEVKVHNRNKMMPPISKLYDLEMAKKVGLKIPHTVFSQGIDRKEQIVKPVTGGAHVAEGNEATYPCIIQDKIVGKNIRIYAIKGTIFAFEIMTSMIDYREDSEVDCKCVEVPGDLKQKLIELNKLLDLSFTASDFMFDGTDYYYLETNDMPMFIVFDNKTKGKLGECLYKELCK